MANPNQVTGQTVLMNLAWQAGSTACRKGLEIGTAVLVGATKAVCWATRKICVLSKPYVQKGLRWASSQFDQLQKRLRDRTVAPSKSESDYDALVDGIPPAYKTPEYFYNQIKNHMLKCYLTSDYDSLVSDIYQATDENTLEQLKDLMGNMKPSLAATPKKLAEKLISAKLERLEYKKLVAERERLLSPFNSNGDRILTLKSLTMSASRLPNNYVHFNCKKAQVEANKPGLKAFLDYVDSLPVYELIHLAACIQAEPESEKKLRQPSQRRTPPTLKFSGKSQASIEKLKKLKKLKKYVEQKSKAVREIKEKIDNADTYQILPYAVESISKVACERSRIRLAADYSLKFNTLYRGPEFP